MVSLYILIVNDTNGVEKNNQMRGERTHVSNLTKLTFRYSVANRLILNHLTKLLRTRRFNKRKYTSNEYIVCLSTNTLNSTITIRNNITNCLLSFVSVGMGRKKQ